MGNLTSTPSLPPLDLCSNSLFLDPRFSFLCDNKAWPILHILSPFTIHYFFGFFWLSFASIFLNESVEALGTLFINKVQADILSETITDALVGDVINGFIGILLAYLLRRLIGYNFFFLSPTLYQLVIVLQISFQCLLLLGGGVVSLNFYFSNGVFSIGQIIHPIWTVIWVLIVYQWNKKGPIWTKKNKENGVWTYKLYFIRKQMTTADQLKVWKFHIAYLVFSVLFILSFVFRYTNVYLMSVLHGAIFALIIWMLKGIL